MGRVNLIIDGESIKVRDDTTVLEAATAHGITICALCHIEGLIPGRCVPRLRGGSGRFWNADRRPPDSRFQWYGGADSADQGCSGPQNESEAAAHHPYRFLRSYLSSEIYK